MRRLRRGKAAASAQPADAAGGPAFRAAQICFLAMVALLAWMKTPVSIGGLNAYPADFLFVATALLWLGALLRQETAVRWHRAYWLLGLYFAAMALSVPQSLDPRQSAFKLLTQVYLLGLPVLAFNLIRTMDDFRRVARWWAASAAALVGLGVVTLLLFPFLGPDGILDWSLHHFGTLPPGPYPRLELTFTYPSTLANYLSVVLMLVLVGAHLGWFDRRTASALGIGLIVCAFFALTPSFGGMLFVIGAFVWYSEREARPRLARAALLTGLAMPFVGALLATATPILHPTAPYLIDLPLGITLAPAIRLLAWTEAVQNFLASPLFGRGIGMETVAVFFEQENLCSGFCVGDAHNVFLSIAVQTGIFGVVAVLAMIGFVATKLKTPPARSPADVVTFGLAIAWLSGFALQGLVGSFEDARHLWIIFGLLLTASQCAERHAPRTAGT